MKNTGLLKYVIFGIVLLLFGCTKVEIPKPDVSEFIISSDIEITLVAAEPDVVLPVAMVEDQDKRFWVVEMPGYMRDIDGNDESLPDGRIVILSDKDKDGYYENRKVFLDSLENPRALCFINNGLLFTSGTNLLWSPIENDRAVKIEIVDSLYVVGGNIEHQPNGLLYNIDNWIYSAKSNARYRLKNGKWEKEATTFRGQWGITSDWRGRLFYNHNSAPLIGDYSIPNQHLNNPYFQSSSLTNQYLTQDMRIFPIQATSVNRGYQPEVLDSSGKVINYTSACAPHLYYGSGLGDEYYEHTFVCAPEGNLIARYNFNGKELTANRISDTAEFLVSKDESFRPVNLHTSFEGELYIVDMRKGIIQHSAYMSSYLRENILKKGLDKINGKGRIYRISSKDNEVNSSKLEHLSPKSIRSHFEHPNLQIRLNAQKQIVYHEDKIWTDSLLAIAKDSPLPYAKIHALWTLEGLNHLTPEIIFNLSENTQNEDVVAHLIIVSNTIQKDGSDYSEMYDKALLHESKIIDLQLANSINHHNSPDFLWQNLAQRYPEDKQVIEALVSNSAGREMELSRLAKSANQTLKDKLFQTHQNRINNEIYSPQLITEAFDDDRTNGLKKYKLYCASCHGIDGKGQVNVAPSLKSSTIIQGKEQKIASIILHGYESPNETYAIPMPAYKEDRNMTDHDIYDIISYLKSTFTKDWNTLTLDEIKSIRKENQ